MTPFRIDEISFVFTLVLSPNKRRKQTSKMKAKEITLIFAGYRVQLAYRSRDEDAVDRDEPIFFDRFETNCGVQLSFKLPKNIKAMRSLLTTGRFVQFEPVMKSVKCEEAEAQVGRGFGHDAMRGILSQPETWEPVSRFPDDWPSERGKRRASKAGMVKKEGLACGGASLLAAHAIMDGEGPQYFDSKGRGVEVKELLKFWPWLKSQMELI